MSADEGGLGAERLATWRRIAEVIAAHLPVYQDETGVVVDCYCYPESDEANGDQEHAEHVAFLVVAVIADEVDRLTRERDEAREVIERVRGLMSAAKRRAEESPSRDFHGRPFHLGPPFDALRAALSDERASGPDPAADRSQGPCRPSQGATSADEGPHFDDAAWIRDHLEPDPDIWQWAWRPDGKPVRHDEQEQG